MYVAWIGVTLGRACNRKGPFLIMGAMTLHAINLDFPRGWSAEILSHRPLILPEQHFAYPKEVEEVERGALEVLVVPAGGSKRDGAFLATCALGFRDPAVAMGVWSMPNPDCMCAVSGGYAYLIDTTRPERFEMVEYRPVLSVLPVVDAGVLLFIGHHGIVAWNSQGKAWQTPRLSWEGIAIDSVDIGSEQNLVRGRGWDLMTDRDAPFVVDLATGERVD